MTIERYAETCDSLDTALQIAPHNSKTKETRNLPLQNYNKENHERKELDFRYIMNRLSHQSPVKS
jgi:hypothetical protein